MAALTPHARAQLLRIVRIAITSLAAQPAISWLISSTLVRYPLVAAVVIAIEVTYHEVTKPVDVVVPGSRPASPPTDTYLS